MQSIWGGGVKKKIEKSRDKYKSCSACEPRVNAHSILLARWNIIKPTLQRSSKQSLQSHLKIPISNKLFNIEDICQDHSLWLVNPV